MITFWPLICLVFAFVLFMVAAFVPVPEPWPWRWPWRLLCLGLAFHVLASILPAH
jgi:hypothetical protein